MANLPSYTITHERLCVEKFSSRFSFHLWIFTNRLRQFNFSDKNLWLFANANVSSFSANNASLCVREKLVDIPTKPMAVMQPIFSLTHSHLSLSLLSTIYIEKAIWFYRKSSFSIHESAWINNRKLFKHKIIKFSPCRHLSI